MAQAKAAASQGGTQGGQGKASKNSVVSHGAGTRIFWERCNGGTLKTCKEGMKAVEKQVLEKLQGLGQIIIYEPLDKGIYLSEFLIDTEIFIGVVTIGINLGGTYYVCIRVSRVQGQAWKLEGFIVTEFPDIVMVEQGQYDIFLGPQRFPKGWVPCSGDVIKNAMNSIKKQFFETAKKYGYVPVNGDNGYDPSNSGITLNLTKDDVGAICYIGFVQLSKKDEFSFYYASIKISQYEGIISPPKPIPPELLGFIIDNKPWLQFVADGVYRVPASIISAPAEDDAKSSEKGSNNKKDGLIFGSHQMNYIPTEEVQDLVNGCKDIIKREANITGDLDTYQVVSATRLNQQLWLGYTIFCKIYIGIDDVTNFTNFIYVKIFCGNTLFFVQGAETFPF